MSVKSVLIVGVGGQGTLLASKLLGSVLVSCGFDVKVSEVHGMSQRGGSVVTYVRYGEEVASPIIDLGEADVILSFEKLEAARYLPYLKKGGVIVTNTQQIDPMPVITGAADYPSNIVSDIEAMGVRVVTCDALEIAKKAGSVKAVNVVLLGVLARNLDIEREVWLTAVEENVPPKFRELNLNAFNMAYDG
ncbi:MAG: indolepyruvate oxidoreductase subunit beta [Oscillospiraceae bacterium]|jgi:indolepyruvate ferredoxin oxidoreductase beta subunit|nr:indolepyruvate oxidoreductase subunit beta [Oscillospiraceae bacterium]